MPINSLFKGAWRVAQLPTTDSQKAISVLNYDKDIDFSKPIQKGDVILGYTVTSGFGLRDAPLDGASTDHKGIDLATPEGTPLYVIGNVENKDGFTGYGDVFCDNDLFGQNKEGIAAYVTVPNFPNVEFVYWHLKSCSSGRLPVGSKFAETGNTGNSSGAHLHFGMRVNGKDVQPTTGALRWSLEGKEPQKVATKSKVEKLRNAIAGQESNNDPSAINTDSYATGYTQIMPDNIPPWTKECLGYEVPRDKFLASKELQIKVSDCKIKEALEDAAKLTSDEDIQIRKAASIWYSGDPKLYDNTRIQTYGANEYPSINDYGLQVLKRYKEQK